MGCRKGLEGPRGALGQWNTEGVMSIFPGTAELVFPLCSTLSVTVPPTRDLAQGTGIFPGDHGQRRALYRAVGHVGHGAVPS